MNNKYHFIPIAFLFLIFAYSCGKDDPTPDRDNMDTGQVIEDDVQDDPMPEPGSMLETMRGENIEILAGSSEKTWRIDSATLTNVSGSFDISDIFNVQDDEFTFKTTTIAGKNSTEFEGTLEWSQKNVINYFGESIETIKNEYYVLSEEYSFDFIPESASEIAVEGLNLDFTLQADDTLIGTLVISLTTTLDLLLVEKQASEYPQIPGGILNFTELFSFESTGIDNQAADMIGSLSNNSFYIATREESLVDQFGTEPERVIRYDFETGSINDRVLYFYPDFVSKEIFVYNNELKVIGAQRLVTYDLELANEGVTSIGYTQTSGSSSTFFTRFGAAIAGDYVYITGGALGNDFELSDKIFRIDLTTDIMTEYATMPERRFGARAEIVDNKLYIFGGTNVYYGPDAVNTILIYDLETTSLTTAEMNRPVNFTFTGKSGDLIYVGGRVDTYDAGNELVDRDPFLGVYNTANGEFRELSNNLQSPAMETIHSMTVFDNRLYVLHGEGQDLAPGELNTWPVLVADLE